MNAPAPALDPAAFQDLLRRYLDEDHAGEDRTSEALVDPATRAVGEVRLKEPGVVCGLVLLEPLFALLDPEAQAERLVEEGARAGAGTVLARVHGRARALLAGERTALNLLQRLCGVATLTAAYVEAAMATGTWVLDTRKTTPGLRALERYAVRCGGGHNHRLHLADAVMVKENHLQAAFGGTGPAAVAEALRVLLAQTAPGTALYVEVEDLAELDAALAAGAGRAADLVLMLDDFGLEEVRAAVRRLRALPAPRPRLEATGGVTLESLGALASTGVHRVSAGRLTHGARALDLSLKIRRVPDPTT